MSESVATQIKETPKVVFGTLTRTPVLAIGVMFFVLLIVLLVEAYKPGLITNPIRRLLGVVGVKA